MLDERNIQTVPTQFNFFKNKGNVETMLDESLNQFKLDSTLTLQTSFQHYFTLLTMLNDLFKRLRHLVQQSVSQVLNVR